MAAEAPPPAPAPAPPAPGSAPPAPPGGAPAPGAAPARAPGAEGGSGAGGAGGGWRALRRRAELWEGPGAGAGVATEAGAGRLARRAGRVEDGEGAVLVELAGDGYRAWLDREAWERAEPAQGPVAAGGAGTGPGGGGPGPGPAAAAAAERLARGSGPYLWGGCLGPRYDCSGFVQAAFLEGAGAWLPRDAYQQCAFADPVPREEVRRGDLIFFAPPSSGGEEGSPSRTDHVGLCTGECKGRGGALRYLHSSGAAMGRGGVGEDVLPAPGQPPAALTDPVSRRYAGRVAGFGRVAHGLQVGQAVPQVGFGDEPPRGEATAG